MWGGEVWLYGNEVGASSRGKRVFVSIFVAVGRQETIKQKCLLLRETLGDPRGRAALQWPWATVRRWTPAPPQSLGYCMKGQPAGTLVPSCEGRRQAPSGSLVDSSYETGVGSWEGGTRQQEDSAGGGHGG